MKTMKAQLVVSLVLLSASVYAQKEESPFLRIGGETVSYGEFNHLYLQNRDVSLLPIGREEYATLFTNYKLKALEAKALGIDTTAAYVKEVNGYIDELARPYLTDTLAIGRFASVERRRSTEEVHAAHILISCRPNTAPADTLKAYNKALEAREKVVAGADFASLARAISDDPSAKQNAGDLGYFSAMQMVMPFEDAAYNTPVGETSGVFRTQFGFHFLHVYDRRPVEGQVRVKHIMILNGDEEQEGGVEDRAKVRIDSLYDALVNYGADFDTLAMRYSDDRQSASRGGLMPWFSRNQILPEFATAAFDLQANGDISRPVRTSAGWHIICRVDRRALMPQEEFDAMIDRAKDQAPVLRQMPRRERMAQLAREYGFRWVESARDTLLNIMITNHTATLRKAAIDRVAGRPLATIEGHTFTFADARRHISHWNVRNTPSDNARDIAHDIIADYEKERLADKSADFRYSSAEYRDGLLTFEFMQRNVWSVNPDSVAIQRQYEARPGRYATGGTFDGVIYFCPSVKVADKVRSLVAKGKSDKAASMALKVVGGPIKQGDIYDDILWPATPVSPFVVVSGTISNGTTMPLEQCRGRVIADLQSIAEVDIINALRAKYQPKQLISLK